MIQSQHWQDYFVSDPLDVFFFAVVIVVFVVVVIVVFVVFVVVQPSGCC